MNETTTLRFLAVEDDEGNESMEERDALLAIELTGGGGREIDVHLSPRTDEVETFALSAEEAWDFARELARAASAAEAALNARLDFGPGIHRSVVEAAARRIEAVADLDRQGIDTEMTDDAAIHGGDEDTASDTEQALRRRLGAAEERASASKVTTQNRRGEWVPAIPLPLYGVRKKCLVCGAKFWTMNRYREHYALHHILDPAPHRKGRKR